MRSVLCQKRIADCFFPEHLVFHDSTSIANYTALKGIGGYVGKTQEVQRSRAPFQELFGNLAGVIRHKKTLR
jgi:hypothetical protein